ncbi:MAG: type II secretion system F family protein [Planctomycetales bacterium]
MTTGTIFFVGVVFVMMVAMVVLIALFFGGKKDDLDERITSEFKGMESADSAAEMRHMRTGLEKKLAEMGKLILPEEEDQERTALQGRLIQAGLYSAQAMPVFMGVKICLIAAPPIVGFLVGLVTPLGPMWGGLLGSMGCIIGLAGPSFWLDQRKGARQTSVRRGLPDAMDVLVICLEGGLSLDAGLARVAGELEVAHPVLAMEFNICQRQITLGQNVGEALTNLSKRVDMEELRSLSAVVAQAQKYGASLANALRVHAETLRQKRAQGAEEMAHKAGTKMLFPTLLFIFPGIFLVILGPAVMRILDTLGSATK